MDKNEKNELQQSLRTCRSEYKKVKKRIMKIGFICEGSLVERCIPCGNKNCTCHKSPDKLHGPYYQLSWKEKGKTVTRLLSKQEAALYREWIENRRTLKSLIDEILVISNVAKNLIYKQKNIQHRYPKIYN